jgi:hypothetical protein
MHGIGATALSRRDDGCNIEITLARGGGANALRPIGEAHVPCILVGVRMDRDGFDPQFLCRSDDAAGNLASIGDEQAARKCRVPGAHVSLQRGFS